MNQGRGKLFLLPAYLHPGWPEAWVTDYLRQVISENQIYFAENGKTARKIIKEILPEKKQAELHIFEFDKNAQIADFPEFQNYLAEGQNICYLSEAGLPCIADPGAALVEYCHVHGYQVVPLSGPSSIILALISSGFNGQNFVFHGYLPIDKNHRKAAVLKMFQEYTSGGYTQIFMETPYRNNALIQDLCTYLPGDARLCLAANILAPSDAFIKTDTIRNWKKNLPDLHKIPCIFLLG